MVVTFWVFFYDFFVKHGYGLIGHLIRVRVIFDSFFGSPPLTYGNVVYETS